MATLRHVAGLASLALITACYRQEPDLYSTFPEPTEVEGPPGGVIDRDWQSGYVDDNAATTDTAYVDSSVAPPATGELVGSCTDGEIAATLDPYGEWVYIEGYGDVWRPYPTTVGVGFTPYETCGTWVWTEWGWTFACEWDWGWLPFHYGRWGWFDDYWAWVPGYEWSPAWVEWRSGGGYVGWRPLAPTVRDHRTGHVGPIVRDHRSSRPGKHDGPIVRDHRSSRPGKHDGPIVRDHRSSRVRDHRRVASAKDWQWRFAATDDLGKPRIRSHLYKGLAEGLRVTATASRPPARASVQQVKVASIMHPRLAFTSRAARNNRVVPVRAHGRVEPAPVRAGVVNRIPERARTQRPAFDRSSSSVYQPTWQRPRPPRGSFGASQPTTVAPDRGATPTPTISSPTPPTREPLTPRVPEHQQPTTIAPPAPTTPPHVPDRFGPRPPVIRPPTRASDGYRPSQPPVRAPERYQPRPPIVQPPTRAPERYTPPTHIPPTYSPPTRSAPTYSPPARSAPTYSPPARSAPSRSYSPPARSPSPPARASSPRGRR